MITKLRLENFKSFKEPQEIPFSPITLLYGPNSGGKSSILHSLLLLKQSGHVCREKREILSLVPQGKLINLGSFRSMVHSHDIEKEIRIGMAFSISSQSKAEEALHLKTPYLAEINFSRYFEKARTLEVALGFGALTREKYSGILSELGMKIEWPEGMKTEFRTRLAARPEAIEKNGEFSGNDAKAKYFTFSSKKELVMLAEFINVFGMAYFEYPWSAIKKLILSSGLTCLFSQESLLMDTFLCEKLSEKISQLLPKSKIPMALLEEYDALARFSDEFDCFLKLISNDFVALLDSIVYLGPLRSYPDRFYITGDAAQESVGVKGEFTQELLFRRFASIKTILNRWLSKLGFPYRINSTVLGNEITGRILVNTLYEKNKKINISPVDVGFGISQLLPILVQGLISRDRVICVEQPEIHLHPKLQADLADFFISTSVVGGNLGKSRNQWLIETHSEALILRLQRRIREKSLKNTDLEVLFVEPAPKGHRIHRLRLDENGNFIDKWPGGFFEESFKEIFS